MSLDNKKTAFVDINDYLIMIFNCLQPPILWPHFVYYLKIKIAFVDEGGPIAVLIFNIGQQ